MRENKIKRAEEREKKQRARTRVRGLLYLEDGSHRRLCGDDALLERLGKVGDAPVVHHDLVEVDLLVLVAVKLHEEVEEAFEAVHLEDREGLAALNEVEERRRVLTF